MGMRFQHRHAQIKVDPLVDGLVAVEIERFQYCPSNEDLTLICFKAREWRALSRHVEEAIREAALLRRRAKSAERRKRDAMKGTR